MSDDATEERDVVTVFLRNGADVLLLRRSEDVGSYAGQWGAVAGHAEGTPDEMAREEIREETGIETATLVRRGDPFEVEDADAGVRWTVHPYLFEVETRDVTANYETSEWAWVSPVEILSRDTVPDLWTSYARVAPDVDTVREDREHGSAALSYRALEVLRDHAAAAAAGRDEPARPDGDDPLADLAEELLAARESMAVVGNRVNRAMHRAGGSSPEQVRDAAERTLREAVAADRAAASEAAAAVSEAGGRVLTLSRSGTVRDALREGAREVVVCESRPAREGVGVAEALSDDCEVTLCIDAAAAHELLDCDAVLVGADAVLPDGRVVNKVGTRGVAAAAAREGVPVFVACAGDKVRAADRQGGRDVSERGAERPASRAAERGEAATGVSGGTASRPDDRVDLEPGPASDVYGGDADLRVDNPTFDVTPADLVTVVTEDGPLDADDVRERAREHRALAGWRG